jgi:Ca2+-binding EF-hand superfamily protein
MDISAGGLSQIVGSLAEQQLDIPYSLMLAEADVNEDGELDLDEFSLMMVAQMTEQGLPAPTIDQLAEAFATFESQGGTFISAGELSQIVTDLTEQ